jgi:integrase
VNDTYRKRSDVQFLADKILEPINSGAVVPESSMKVAEFVQHHYLPWVKANLRPATLHTYSEAWRCHVKDRVGKITLREFRTVHGQRLIQSIDGIGHTSLQRVKSFLSGVFTFAKQEGILDGVNPMQGVRVKGRPSKPQMPVYSIEEIDNAVSLLSEPARTIWIVAAFSGLRVSELRGLRWDDWDGDKLFVRRSVWRTHLNAPKTLESEAPVPVLPAIARILEEHRARCKSPTADSYIFAGERRGTPLNLANLARRTIKPSIERCLTCEKPRTEHETSDHPFLLDPSLTWKGFHALRRGLAQNLFAMGIPPRTIQSVLRHSSMAMTMQFYVRGEQDKARTALKSLTDWFYPLG